MTQSNPSLLDRSSADPLLSSALPEGLVLDGRYSILRRIGQGATSTVYAAEHLVLRRTVAVKVLHERHTHDTTSLMRFQREAIAESQLYHPSIVQVFGFSSYKNLVFIAMEYLQGTGLAELIATEGCLSPERTMHLVKQMCDALEYSHQRGIIHRDLKPSNIIVLPDDRVKIVDFGIAKLTDPRHNITTLTGTSELFGTPQYMSPEQCYGGVVDHRADIYSLGCIMYAMLTGHPPFDGDTAYATIHKHITDEPAWHPNLDNRVGQVALAALSKSAQERPESAAKLSDYLTNTSEKVSTIKCSRFVTQVPWAPLVIAGTALLLIVAATPCLIVLNNILRPCPATKLVDADAGFDYEFNRRQQAIDAAYRNNDLEFCRQLLGELHAIAQRRNNWFYNERAVFSETSFNLKINAPGTTQALDAQIKRLAARANTRDVCELLREAAAARAQLYVAEGKPERALALLDDVASSVDGRNRQELEQGANDFAFYRINLLPKEQNELARHRYRVLRAAYNEREFRNMPPYLAGLSLGFSARGDYQTALDVINYAIQLRPRMKELYTIRQDVYKNLGKLDLADKDARTVATLDVERVD